MFLSIYLSLWGVIQDIAAWIWEHLFLSFRDLWFSLTAWDDTIIGELIEKALWLGLGIIGLICVLGGLGSLVSIPTSLSTSEKVKDAKKPSNKQRCCANCTFYNSYNGSCNCDTKGKRIFSPYDKKCSLFKLR